LELSSEVRDTVNVKAQGLFNATIWIEQTFGQIALRDVLRACRPETRETYTSSTAINWHPVEEFVDALGVADRILGVGDGTLAIDIGAAGARINARNAALRVALYVAKPEMLIRRVGSFWRQFNDEGLVTVFDVTRRGAHFEATGIAVTHEIFCNTLTGWSRELASGAGARSVTARHIECKGRGDKRCIWETRWLPVSVATP
jgi:hypothetical protein